MPTQIEVDEYKLRQEQVRALLKIADELPNITKKLESIARQLELNREMKV